MRPSRSLALGALAPFIVALGLSRPVAADYIHHRLEIALDPATSSIAVSDEIRLAAPSTGGPVEFLLNAVLEIESSDPAVERVPLGDFDGFFGINGASIQLAPDQELARYRLTSLPESGVLALSYRGRVNFGLSDQKEEYTRGFCETYCFVG